MEKTQLFEDKIFVVRNALTPGECQAWIDRANQRGFKKSSVSGGGHGRTGKEDARISSFAVIDNIEWADILWNKLKSFIPTDLTGISTTGYLTTDHKEWHPVGINPHLRIYQYLPGEVFPEHIDYKMCRRVVRGGKHYQQMTFYSVLIYLNSDFGEGQTGLIYIIFHIKLPF